MILCTTFVPTKQVLLTFAYFFTYRGDDGEFEPLDIVPFSEFPVIPEEIKMHLRNYVPPPPPKKGGNNAKAGNNPKK